MSFMVIMVVSSVTIGFVIGRMTDDDRPFTDARRRRHLRDKSRRRGGSRQVGL